MSRANAVGRAVSGLGGLERGVSTLMPRCCSFRALSHAAQVKEGGRDEASAVCPPAAVRQSPTPLLATKPSAANFAVLGVASVPKKYALTATPLFVVFSTKSQP